MKKKIHRLIFCRLIFDRLCFHRLLFRRFLFCRLSLHQCIFRRHFHRHRPDPRVRDGDESDQQKDLRPNVAAAAGIKKLILRIRVRRFVDVSSFGVVVAVGVVVDVAVEAAAAVLSPQDAGEGRFLLLYCNV